MTEPGSCCLFQYCLLREIQGRSRRKILFVNSSICKIAGVKFKVIIKIYNNSHIIPANFLFLIDFSQVASPACEHHSNQMFEKLSP